MKPQELSTSASDKHRSPLVDMGRQLRRLLLLNEIPSRAEMDRFKQRGWRDNRYIDPSQIADLLSSTEASLKDLGVEVTTAADDADEGILVGMSPHTTQFWDKLLQVLDVAYPRDALVIFGAMARTLKEHPMEDRGTLMSVAFDATDWGLQAIKSHPDFFLAVKTKPGALFRLPEQQASNALQVLASLRSGTKHSYAHTLSLIQALQDIGAQDAPNPRGLCTSLHQAASCLASESFKAFLDVFPHHLEATDQRGARPLHFAADAADFKNTSLLLAAGAEPRPSEENGETPLSRATSGYCFEQAAILLGTGAYGAHELDAACKTFRGSGQEDRLRAIHAAAMAKDVINGVTAADSPTLKPL